MSWLISTTLFTPARRASESTHETASIRPFRTDWTFQILVPRPFSCSPLITVFKSLSQQSTYLFYRYVKADNLIVNTSHKNRCPGSSGTFVEFPRKTSWGYTKTGSPIFASTGGRVFWLTNFLSLRSTKKVKNICVLWLQGEVVFLWILHFSSNSSVCFEINAFLLN
jgi:hypothetical protein